jgi:hypothetical protein
MPTPSGPVSFFWLYYKVDQCRSIFIPAAIPISFISFIAHIDIIRLLCFCSFEIILFAPVAYHGHVAGADFKFTTCKLSSKFARDNAQR